MTRSAALGAQLAATEVGSLLLFGLGAGHWVAGLLAPVWGLALPIVLVGDVLSGSTPPAPMLRFMIVVCTVAISLAVVVGYSLRGRFSRSVGHLALFFFNATSVAAIAALE